jgi:hypothetical protein
MDLKNELDLDFYISMNEDIAHKFEFNYEKIKLHFEQTGKNEQRYFSKFHSLLYYQHNWIKYLNKNNDLVKNKINNEKLAFKHYIEYGIKEKRDIYPIDEVEKKNISNELKSLEIELLKKTPSITFIQEYHPSMKDKQKAEIVKYVNKNLNKKGFAFSLYHEDLFKNYNWDDYLTYNLDLRNSNIISHNDAFIHYISCGEEEGRILKKIKTQQEIDDENNLINEQKNEIKNEVLTPLNEIEQKNIENFNEKSNKNEPLILDIDKTFNLHINPLLNQNNNKDELFELIKQNINLNHDFIDENIYIQPEINYSHFLYLFDEKYYYLLNSQYYSIENNKESCLNHFINFGINNYLPFQKEHYLIFINSCWSSYKKENYLNIDLTDHEAFIHFIKNKVYLNKSIPNPVCKFKQEQFINSFYNLLYDVIEDNISINYYYFINNENSDKLFPSNFYYYIYEFIDWNNFKKKNNLDLSTIECFKLFIKHLDDFSKFKLDFNLNQEIKIHNKKELLENQLFKDFYNKIIQYIHQHKSIIELHKYYSVIFNQSIIQFPKHFQFKKSNNEENKSYHFNFIVNYINYYDSLINVLLTLIYQNYRYFKIIILNKNDDKQLKEKIDHFKNVYQFQSIEIIEFNEYQNIKFEKYIDIFDFNIFLDTNYYLSNNFILTQFIDHFNNNQDIIKQISVEKVEVNKNIFNGLVLLNSFLLFNNPHLIHNYLYIEKDVIQLNSLIIPNNLEYLNHDYYNYDETINSLYELKEPIFIFYSNEEQLKHIQIDSFYYLIKINHSNVIFDFYQTFIKKNIFDYGIFIYLDKINDFKSIIFDLIDEFYNKFQMMTLIKDKKNKKAKNITLKSKIIPNLNDYNAFICTKDCIQKYVNKK